MAASFDFKLDPFQNFSKLFEQAKSLISKDPNAMSLATASSDGIPSLRTVLYKGMLRGGVSFYTNYESQKSKELLSNSKAALLFFWPSLDMQIRFEGLVSKLTQAESEAYFKTRPRLSQLGAWASHQSQKIANHEELEAKVQELDKKFSKQEITCPPHWGGFHLLPLKVEFWFARIGRLHDRFVFERNEVSQNNWERYLKSP